jgi:exosortase
MSSVADRLPVRPSSPEAVVPQAIPWVGVAWVVGLIILCYLPVLSRLTEQWRIDDDMGHGFFVPVVAGYIAWTRREALFQAEMRPNYWGLAVIAWGAFQLLLGTVGAELFLQRSAIVISVAGCVLLVCGRDVLRVLAFPISLLLFMVPLPRIIYTQITFPLQLFATQVAETALNFLDIPALRDGNILELANEKLSVVEACSGIRSLLSLSFLSLVYAFFFDQKPWMRWVLLLLTIPIAILANAGRVTITGILSYYRPELAHGFFHSVEGWVIFVIDVGMLYLAHRLVNFIYKAVHDKQNPAHAA